jgi:hypothetical protein
LSTNFSEILSVLDFPSTDISTRSPFSSGSHQGTENELASLEAIRFSFYRQLFSAIFGVKPQKVLGRFVEVRRPPSEKSRPSPSLVLAAFFSNLPPLSRRDGAHE